MEFTTNKLDPEGLGIILLNAFMEYFFSYEKRSTPDTFHLLHYNGIPRSNFEDKVSGIESSQATGTDFAVLFALIRNFYWNQPNSNPFE